MLTYIGIVDPQQYRIVLKRKGFTQGFSSQKIKLSIINAGASTQHAEIISKSVQMQLFESHDIKDPIKTSEVRELVISELNNKGMNNIAKSYSSH